METNGWGQRKAKDGVLWIGGVHLDVIRRKKGLEDCPRALPFKRLGHLLRCERTGTGLVLDLFLTVPNCSVNKSVHLM